MRTYESLRRAHFIFQPPTKCFLVTEKEARKCVLAELFKSLEEPVRGYYSRTDGPYRVASAQTKLIYNSILMPPYGPCCTNI